MDLARGEHRQRVLSLPKDRPLKGAIADFLEHRRATVERATWAADHTSMVHLSKALGNRRVASVEPEDIQRLMDSLVQRGYRATTIGTYLKCITVFFRWTGYDPTGDVKLPDRGKTDVITFEPPELAKVLDAARKVDAQRTRDSPSAVLAVHIALAMGLRMGEVFALRWEAIDPEEKAVRVNWQIPKYGQTPKPLKGKLARTALVMPEWWNHHREATGYIVGKNGRPVASRTQRNIITRVLDTAGLNRLGLGWHVLRHQYARHFVERGGRLEELKLSLGHSSIVTTERIYGHFKEDTAVRLARGRIYGVS